MFGGVPVERSERAFPIAGGESESRLAEQGDFALEGVGLVLPNLVSIVGR